MSKENCESYKSQIKELKERLKEKGKLYDKLQEKNTILDTALNEVEDSESVLKDIDEVKDIIARKDQAIENLAYSYDEIVNINQSLKEKNEYLEKHNKIWNFLRCSWWKIIFVIFSIIFVWHQKSVYLKLGEYELRIPNINEGVRHGTKPLSGAQP